MVELADTHCHIHFDDYGLEADKVIKDAVKAGVTKMICVGCSIEDSKYGVEFVQAQDNCWASIGLHPHDAKKYVGNRKILDEFSQLAAKPKVIAIGETGLDYHYNNSPKQDQIKMLEFQLELANENNLPVIFHVRDAFDDFWPIVDKFSNITGVIHSFSSDYKTAQEALNRGFYIGLNGIMTFTKFQDQLDMAKKLPLNRIVLETDAPFLTPNPYRGKVCEPKHIETIAKFLSELRGESYEEFATQTLKNSETLFGI